MAGSRARRLRRQKRQQGHQGGHHQEDQLEESTTYSELLATTIPANSSQNADKVAQTLGIVQNGVHRYSGRCSTVTHFQTVSYSTPSPVRDVAPEDTGCETDGELAARLRSKSHPNLVASIFTTNHTHTRHRTLPRCPQTRDDSSYNQDGCSEQGGQRKQEWYVCTKL